MSIVDKLREDRESGAKWLEAEYKAGLLTLARRLCADEGDAEELVNRTFAAVVEGIDDYLEQSAFFGWMCQILSNIHAKDVRRKMHGAVICPGDVPELPNDGDVRLFREVDAALLRDAIEELPPEMRDAMMMRYFMDMPLAKVAKILAVPVGTVNSRLHYARRILAARLGAATKKPGAKALLIALALATLTAVGAVVAVVATTPSSATSLTDVRDGQNADNTPLANRPLPTWVHGFSTIPDFESACVPPADTTPSHASFASPALSGNSPTTDQGTPTMHTTVKATALLATASLALTATGADWYVAPDGTGGGTSTSDRGALMDVLYNGQVASGDTIHLATGTYNLDVSKSPEGHVPGYGGYLLAKADNLTFIGESNDPEDVRLVGTASDQMRIFVVYNGGCVLRNLLFTGGYTIAQGAGICMADGFVGNAETAFTASNCVVENCSAAYQGGGVFGGLLLDCVIRNNEVRNKGSFPEGSAGGVFHATLYDCVITNNVAGFCGGGIAAGRQNGATSGMTICETKAYNCLIGWNRSVYGGGAAVAPENGTRNYCQLFGCTLVENAAAYDATGDGGGLGGGAYQCVVSNCVVRGNSATRNNDAAFNAYGHTYGVGKGGGVMDCTVIDSTLENNTCTGGGAGASNSDLTGCVLQGNSATGGEIPTSNYGGGAYSCTLVDCVLSGNCAGHGGAAFNGSLERCVMTNNWTTLYVGGATYNANTRNCLVARNIARQYYALCKGTHYGTLVYGNENQSPNHIGGGVFDGDFKASGISSDDPAAPAVAVNCTVWNNDYSSSQVSYTILTNCIVGSVENIPSAVNSFWRTGTVDNQTGCISGEDKDPEFEGVDITLHPSEVANVAPEAYSIKSGSPCRDKGVLLAGQVNEKDLLGNKRVKYDGVDMGALEFVGSLAFTLVIR